MMADSAQYLSYPIGFAVVYSLSIHNFLSCYTIRVQYQECNYVGTSMATILIHNLFIVPSQFPYSWIYILF